MKTQSIDIKLWLFYFTEGKTHFVYSPDLDLTGYGNSKSEAQKSFSIALDEFLKYTTNKDSLFKVLKDLGWKLQKSRGKEYTRYQPAPLTSQFQKNQYLSDIFDNKPFTKAPKKVSLPVYA
jgi:hypothetical protein